MPKRSSPEEEKPYKDVLGEIAALPEDTRFLLIKRADERALASMNRLEGTGTVDCLLDEPGTGHRIMPLVLETIRVATSGVYRESQIEKAQCNDALTGLHNRTHLNEIMEEKLYGCERRGTPLSCIFLDLNGLKLINDQRGHDVGDKVLAAFAQVLRDSIRGADLAFRIGGDEFVVILPETTARNTVRVALRIMENLRRALHLGSFPVVGVSASLGISELDPFVEERSVRGDTMLKAADRRMYAAKGVSKAVPDSPESFVAIADERIFSESELRREMPRIVE